MPSEDLTVVQWRECRKGESLRGFVSLEMPSGLIIHDCAVHNRAGDSWVGLPVREYSKAGGERGWNRIVDFRDKQTYQKFQKAALEAIQRYSAEQSATFATVTEDDVKNVGAKR